MYKTGIVVVALGCLLAVASVDRTAAEASEPMTAGADLFAENKCSTCHAVAAVGIEAKVKIEKMKGPDLGGYKPTREMDEMFAFATQAIEIDAKKHKKKFAGSQEEFQTILAWLGTLDAATE